MNAFLTLDTCARCHREVSWEWVPPVTVGGQALAGTGVWCSTLSDGLCPTCTELSAFDQRRNDSRTSLRRRFITILGVVPYRNFTLERYQVDAANQAAADAAKAFTPSKDNLYLWGRPGVGKTHLAIAILRRHFGMGPTFFTTPLQLSRRIRMKPPEDEQRIIDECVQARVLVLDNLMPLREQSSFARQVLQEILDSRRYRNTGGLVVTSICSPMMLREGTDDASLQSRLVGMCRVIEIRGRDRRQLGQAQP